MPYINEDSRKKITRGYTEMIDREYISTPGDIQYVIALLAKDYLAKNGMSYSTCNDIMGALSGAQMEFYRRHVSSYEDSKIIENGDV